MFSNLFKKNSTGSNSQTITLRIIGMHCTACSINIDSSLEDIEGVVLASTSYAKSVTKVSFDPQKVTIKQLIDTIKAVGYEAEVSK
jgi:copper chaperone CopZ